MLLNARSTTPTTPPDTARGRSTPQAPPTSDISSALRLVQALGGALAVLLLAALLVTARQASGQAPTADPDRAPSAAAESLRDEVPALPAAAAPSPRAVPKPAKELGRGEASYYHSSLEGHPTASGEPYRATRLTAAHRTLPIGSKVRVTDLRSGKIVTVRINDRGPFHGRRVIDLSHAAARELGMVARGTAKVRLELLTS